MKVGPAHFNENEGRHSVGGAMRGEASIVMPIVAAQRMGYFITFSCTVHKALPGAR